MRINLNKKINEIKNDHGCQLIIDDLIITL